MKMIPKTYSLQRAIPVEEGYDVVVAGGGPAGCGAAIAAARLGAKVLLLEGSGCLGGMGTSGMVSLWYEISDGERMIVGGIVREIIETMFSRGQLPNGRDPNVFQKTLHGGTSFHPEVLKRLLDELCLKAGVEIRFFTRLIDVDVDATTKTVNGVVINNIEGHHYIHQALEVLARY